MLPAEWIRQTEWIEITIIHFLNTVKKKINVRIFHPTIFAHDTSDVKLCFQRYFVHVHFETRS